MTSLFFFFTKINIKELIFVKGYSTKTSDWETIYPIGSIYMSLNSTSPSNLFGGTWEQLKDRFICGAGSNYNGGSTGGNSNHTHSTGSHSLTQSQMPSHGHGVGIRQTSSNYVPYNNTALLSFRNQSEVYSPYINGVLTDMTPHLYTYNNFIEKTGSGEAHNHGNTGSTSNIPPYLAVYMWKRIA